MRKCYISIILVLLFCISGCKKHPEQAAPVTRIVLTADPYTQLLQLETEQFMSLYPQAKMEVRSTSTREAIVHLLNDSVRSIIVDRKFNEEERQVERQLSVRIAENRIAEDGIAVIVNKKNPLSHIEEESLKRIVTGASADWSQIPDARWSGAIDFVLTGRNSGMYELLQKSAFSSTVIPAPSTIKENQRDIIAYVAEHPFAAGCVAASRVIGHEESIKVLPAVVKSEKGKKEDVYPGQQEIHNALYPFHYSLYLYSIETPNSVGLGFSAFVLSNIGQKIIQRAGLVPAFIPYRTIQLNAE
jgi:phosphate transport system substrate-binding protein